MFGRNKSRSTAEPGRAPADPRDPRAERAERKAARKARRRARYGRDSEAASTQASVTGAYPT